MTGRIVRGTVAMMCVLAIQATAGGKEEIQKYFNDTATRTKAAVTAAEKREILDQSFRRVSSALTIAANLPLVSKEDVAGINRLRVALSDKQSELAGTGGYTRVPDSQLNAFSSYVVQDMEQADQTVTISLVTLLIIALVLIVLL